MTCSFYKKEECCQHPDKRALNHRKWGDWVLIDLPPNVPLLYLLGGGSNTRQYRVKTFVDASKKTQILIAPPDLICDYPHVIIRYDPSRENVEFKYEDYHYGPSVKDQRFGKEQIKDIQEVRQFLVTLMLAFLQKNPATALRIAGILGYNAILGKKGIF